MRNSVAIRIFLILFGVSLLLSAQQPKIVLPGEDWVSLFNGADLTGWKPVGKERWVVEDGTILGQAVTKEYGYLATVKTYKDFHFSLRFKCEGSGNSGVFYHSSFQGDTANILGIQVEIDSHIGRHTGGLYGDNRAWIAWPAPENETVLRSQDWNEMLIQVEGNRVRSRLNGVQMIDYTNPKPIYTDGVIAFQLHSGGEGKMRFKDIWIRDLTPR